MTKLACTRTKSRSAEIVKQKAYATCAIGKWHLGHYPEFLPTRQGFDHYFGIPYSNDMGTKPERPDYPPLPLIRGETTIETEPDQSQLTRRYTEEAIKFIREHREQPFFVYLPHTMIHFPLAASADFKDKSQMGLIGDTIEEIDWSVGQIMQTLKSEKLDEQTLVIFTSDNGPARRTAANLRGNKGTTFEGGVREPCMMRWPNKIPQGTVCNEIVGNIDMLPTLAKLVGAQPPTDRVIDGRDISSLMFDPKSGPVRDTHLYFNGGGQLQAIRSGPWKLFLTMPADAAQKAKAKANTEKKGKAAAIIGLFNVVEDAAETKNMAAEHPDIVTRLKALAAEREAEIKKNQRPAGEHVVSK
ncbi:MAG: sulfatase-like hydrolase/transferase [Myxococcales bacterium]